MKAAGQALEPRGGRVAAVVVDEQHREPGRLHRLRRSPAPRRGRSRTGPPGGWGSRDPGGGRAAPRSGRRRPPFPRSPGRSRARAPPPASPIRSAKTEATEAATIPRGASQARKMRSLRTQARAEGRDEHRQRAARPGRGRPRTAARASRARVKSPGAHPGGEEDEERRDQQDPQVLLELDDVLHRHRALVGEDDAHDRHRQEPDSGCARFDAAKAPHHEHQQERALQEVRHPEPAQELERGEGANAPPIASPTTTVSPSCGSMARAAATSPWRERRRGPRRRERPATAPTGSMTMPSQWATVATFPVGRTWRRSGPITVGPVTTTIAPRSSAGPRVEAEDDACPPRRPGPR